MLQSFALGDKVFQLGPYECWLENKWICVSVIEHSTRFSSQSSHTATSTWEVSSGVHVVCACCVLSEGNTMVYSGTELGLVIE